MAAASASPGIAKTENVLAAGDLDHNLYPDKDGKGRMADVTILFATHNGAPTLPRMLDALENLAPGSGPVKIVAVDNASTDGSEELIKARYGRLPITLLSEARLGKNIALNKGLSEIEGDLVVLTDDDIVPNHDWLASIRRVTEEQRGYDIFGGAIYPLWEEMPEEWVLRSVPKGWFGWTDFAEGPIEPTSVWGGNMTVRTKVFSDHRFFEGIGPNGTKKYAMGSDTEFMLRVAKVGHLCWHSRNSAVGHIVRAHQLRPEWLLQRAYNSAKGCHRAKLDNRSGGEVIGELFSAACDLIHANLFGSFEHKFKAKFRLRSSQGALAERCSWRNLHGR
jgi:glycosyltransferase involved in cell wall biosynthesis